jgi:hypothetical protein
MGAQQRLRIQYVIVIALDGGLSVCCGCVLFVLTVFRACARSSRSCYDSTLRCEHVVRLRAARGSNCVVEPASARDNHAGRLAHGRVPIHQHALCVMQAIG